MMDGKTVQNMYSVLQEKIEKQAHLVGCTIRIYYDAQTHERQKFCCLTARHVK